VYIVGKVEEVDVHFRSVEVCYIDVLGRALVTLREPAFMMSQTNISNSNSCWWHL
jgi:hypothetical protein